MKTKKEIQEELETYDKIIILQKELIELYQMKNEDIVKDIKAISKCYESLLKCADDKYKGLIITDGE